MLLDTMQGPGPNQLNGDSQPSSYHGSEQNVAGYNMTITLVPNCFVKDATVMFPLPLTPDFNCTGILYDTWRNCK